MKKIFAVFISILLVAYTFAGCTRIEHNAVIVKEGITCRLEWFENNYTYGAYQSEKQEYDRELPKSRTYVITDQSALDEIFSDFPEIDFGEEMVIVYCYTTIYVREQVLENVVLEEDVLSVEFDVVRGKLGHGDAVAPHTRVCAIRLDTLDVREVNITYNGQ